MENAAIAEYVDLWKQLSDFPLRNVLSEQQVCDRLDELWYFVMTDEDREEAEKKLAKVMKHWSGRKAS